MKHMIMRATASLVLGATLTSIAGAADTTFECAPVGSFTEPLCWSGGVVPGPGDNAVFDLGEHTTAIFGESVINDRLIVRHGDVRFELASATYLLGAGGFTSPGLVIGDDQPTLAKLTLEAGTVECTFMELGRAANASGDLTVTGPATHLLSTATMHVGRLGTGQLRIVDGGAANAERAFIGLGGSSNGSVLLAGADSTWIVAQQVHVGQGGFGSIGLANGALLDAGRGVIGLQVGSEGAVTVDGQDTVWTMADSLDTGFTGTGWLTISGGARVEVGGFAAIATGYVSELEFGFGTIHVTGADSVLDVGTDLYVGISGDATLRIDAGGRAEVGGDIQTQIAFHEVRIGLASSNDYVNAPALSAGGEIDPYLVSIDLLDGFVPVVGDSFRIATAASTPDFDFDLPPLPPSRNWTVHIDGTTVSLAVEGGLAGDVNDDGVVDVWDLIAVITGWGACPVPPPDCPADADGDGHVGVGDLVAVLLDWTS